MPYLTEENQTFLNAVLSAREAGLAGEAAYAMLSVFVPAQG